MNGDTMTTRGRHWPVLAFILLALPWLMAMNGGGGGDAEGSQVPLPARNYTVTITDTTGNSVQAARFTWEAKTFFRARYGNATVSLPFDKIASLQANPGAKAAATDWLPATVTLETGEKIEVSLERSSKCYGETKFGGYEIYFKDVASIAFK
ncbi:MAG: hypothetical protein OEW39_06995 [Deltaproteobacteria bacterium]|nr:hypothetical protein [Deltaproteobacteria bacterium]